MTNHLEILSIVKFGNPILRDAAEPLTKSKLKLSEFKHLIASMQYTNTSKKYGVGTAAPQVGKSVALAIIDIKPSKARPKVPIVSMVIVNPSYEGIGRRSARWEGCLSSGTGRNTLFAKVPRFSKIRARWLDEAGRAHDEELSGIVSHVFQHETDHLNGILFVDKVKDTASYMLASEYKKRIVKVKGGA